MPFEKNDSRINRKGRPKKGQTLSGILDWALDQKREIKGGGTVKAVLLRHLLAEKLISRAVDDGDVAAIKYIYDRIDGRPKETVEMTERLADIPDDPEERRKLAELIEKELVMTGTAEEGGGTGGG